MTKHATFVDGNLASSNLVNASWLNDINTAVYDGIGDGTNAPTTASQVRTNLGLPSSAGSSYISFIHNGAWAAVRSLQTRGREIVSALDATGVVADGSNDDHAGLTAVTAYCKANGKDLWLPPGIYDCKENSFPFGETGSSVQAGLEDWGGMTVWCSGPSTVLQTTSTYGADVIHIVCADNFSLMGYPTIKGTISDVYSGSNGVSIVGGYNRIRLQVSPYNMPTVNKWAFVIDVGTPVVGRVYTTGGNTYTCTYVDNPPTIMYCTKTAGSATPAGTGTMANGIASFTYLSWSTFIDGGAGVTVQNPATGVDASNACGTLQADIRAIGCSYGLDYQPDNYSIVNVPLRPALLVNLYAENCYAGVRYSAGSARGALVQGMTAGLMVRGQTVNCQTDVILGRMLGGKIDLIVHSDKSVANLLKDPSGRQWEFSDSTAEVLRCLYAQGAEIDLSGYKANCTNKATIGAASDLSSTLVTSTTLSQIRLNIGGTASGSNLVAVSDSTGGPTYVMDNSELSITSATGTTIPDAFALASRKNILQINGTLSGSFTATMWENAGGTSLGTATWYYSVASGVVTVSAATMLAASSKTDLTITGFPAVIIPATLRVALVRIQDNSTWAMAVGDVTTGGGMTLYASLGGAVFTAAANKGIGSCDFTYPLNL